jgi:hypothetical protein
MRAKIRLSDEGWDCLDSVGIPELKALPKFKRWVRGIAGSDERVFVEISFKWKGEKTRRTLWADTVTGSLYDPVTSRCLSGDLVIVSTHL